MNDEKFCPFCFDASFGVGNCIKSKCALWVEDVESSACGLAYQSLLDAKIRKRVVQARHLTTGEKILMLNRESEGDSDA